MRARRTNSPGLMSVKEGERDFATSEEQAGQANYSKKKTLGWVSVSTLARGVYLKCF